MSEVTDTKEKTGFDRNVAVVAVKKALQDHRGLVEARPSINECLETVFDSAHLEQWGSQQSPECAWSIINAIHVHIFNSQPPKETGYIKDIYIKGGYQDLSGGGYSRPDSEYVFVRVPMQENPNKAEDYTYLYIDSKVRREIPPLNNLWVTVPYDGRQIVLQANFHRGFGNIIDFQPVGAEQLPEKQLEVAGQIDVVVKNIATEHGGKTIKNIPVIMPT